MKKNWELVKKCWAKKNGYELICVSLVTLIYCLATLNKYDIIIIIKSNENGIPVVSF
jgi:hypothetical protein